MIFETFEITREKNKAIKTNARAKSLLYCIAREAEYNKISTYKMAKLM